MSDSRPDGFYMRCPECGAQWVFEADPAATLIAENKRLRAELDRLTKPNPDVDTPEHFRESESPGKW